MLKRLGVPERGTVVFLMSLCIFGNHHTLNKNRTRRRSCCEVLVQLKTLKVSVATMQRLVAGP